MLNPEPMRHLSLVVLVGDVEGVTQAIARVGVLQLLNVRQLVETVPVVRPYDVDARLAEIDRLMRSLDTALEFLDVAAPPPLLSDQERPVDLSGVAVRSAEIATEVEALRRRLRQVTHDSEQFRNLVRNLRALVGLGVPLEDLSRLRYVHFTSGLLPERNLPRLGDSLARVPHLIVPARSAGVDGRLLITALCLRPGCDVFERALRSAQFERLEVPAHLTGTPVEAIAQLEAQLAASRAAVSALGVERETLRRRVGPELCVLRAAVQRERLLVEARGLMGRSDRVALVAGWVPAVLACRLEEAARAAARGRCVVQWRDPVALEGVRRGRIGVPILLRNPVWVRPFEHLLRGYGLPRYGEVDPTAVLAVAFLVMFGFMFGDVGQGAVLFAIGYFIYRRLFRYRDYALILMECGIFATGFGFLYGSVFGVERWLPALWLRPLDDVHTLIKTALAFGVAFLSVGLVLNFVNAVRRHDTAALWERNGVLAAMAYWIAVGLVMRRLTAGAGAVSLRHAALWLAVPLVLMLVEEPARSVWKGIRTGGWPGAAELFAMMVQSLVEVVDTVVSGVSNTATFIRLAAFAVSHAGLFLATFSVADAVWRSAAGTVGAGLVIVLGNIAIVALEGLIVSIQSVRLEYYEFFSKFYSGSGEEYRPLRFAAAPSSRG